MRLWRFFHSLTLAATKRDNTKRQKLNKTNQNMTQYETLELEDEPQDEQEVLIEYDITTYPSDKEIEKALKIKEEYENDKK